MYGQVVPVGVAVRVRQETRAGLVVPPLLRLPELLQHPVSRRGQDKRGRRRSAAIPHDELSRENVGEMGQNITCNNM